MDIKRILKEAGLAGNEVKVYLALLELGSVTAGKISGESGVNRTNVYDALRSLSEKGLVSHMKKAERRYFEAASPTKFLHHLEEKEDELRRKRAAFEDAVPEMEMKRSLSKEDHEATIYTGRKGLKTVTEDILRTGEELLVFGAEGKFMEVFRTYSRNWQRRRAKAKVHLKIIYSSSHMEKKTGREIPYADIRFNDKLYDTPSTTWVYGGKVAVVVWSDHPVVTLIRSADVAKSYRMFFRELWRSSKGRLQ